MDNIGLKIAKINKDLTLIPEDKLDEVVNFIEFILSKSKTKKRELVNLEGIWEGKGFEKLDLEKELKVARKELSESILKRDI